MPLTDTKDKRTNGRVLLSVQMEFDINAADPSNDREFLTEIRVIAKKTSVYILAPFLSHNHRCEGNCYT